VPYGFQGMRSDGLVSLNFADNRVYNPALMRWLQTDPIGLNAGNNDYEFVGDRPTGALDPSGLQAQKYEYAGPEVADWFFEEIRLFRKHAHDRTEKTLTIGGAMKIADGRVSLDQRLFWLKDIGNRLTDYKARFDKDPAEKDAKRWPFLSGEKLRLAGNYD